MKVKFKENFFSPDGLLEKDVVHTLDDSYLEPGKLPSDAVIVEGVSEEAPEPDPEVQAHAVHKGRGKYDVYKAGKVIGDNLTKADAKEMVEEENGSR